MSTYLMRHFYGGHDAPSQCTWAITSGRRRARPSTRRRTACRGRDGRRWRWPSGHRRGTRQVNRYELQNGSQPALVFYWYQGRGRVEANEYRVKWELLRDAALQRRSDEALVRIVVNLADPGTEDDALRLATLAARRAPGPRALPHRPA